MNKCFFRAAAALLAVLCIAACHRRPLYDLSEGVRLVVEVDTDNISNVTSDIFNTDANLIVPSVTTDMLRVMVYDPSSGKLLTQTFLSEKSVNAKGHEVFTGTVALGVGDYDILVYNFDTPDTQITGENEWSGITAYTSEIPGSLKENYLTKATDFSALKVFYEPDHLFVARERGLHLAMTDEERVLYMTAYPVVDTYYIQIPVVGLNSNPGAVGVISGLSPSNAFADDKPSQDASGVYFQMIKSKDERLAGESKDVICGLFSTFGKLENVSSDVRFTINVADAAGNLHKKDVNLDLVFKTADAIERHWLLLDEPWVIDVPVTPGTSGGGFQPEVDPWEQQEGGIAL